MTRHQTLISLLFAASAIVGCGALDATVQTGTEECVARAGGGVELTAAWVRAQEDQSGMTAAYFNLCNAGEAPVVLVGIDSPAAGIAELHETRRSAAGVVSMAQVSEIEIAPGEAVSFAPGGRHAMLMQLSGPLSAGETAMLTLHFDGGANASVAAEIRDLTHNAEDQSAGHQHH